ncbi:diguanylate cyclase (GGDEF)-like protein [Actinoplanes lutulentus]|uniref:Diguanylate cyclase (GGDEF)-like protein n=1 Tax=Actinoplanes lutulentus TaxID=1287878 RepID=A0A327Z4W4_9ACTN|nr:GGDEF domain-containing protein [Actinoplanes lutulentus]MBB2948890.1 diguanylate cyclase (GGDEF)-like protein [Actinoplanes lutulentus]RAK29800.1 diguanylate cyclase (GGDEF)-like protein [Actinoplanes lutulentus]
MTQSVLNRPDRGEPVDVAVLRASEPEPVTELDAARHARHIRLWWMWLAAALVYCVGQLFTTLTDPVGATMAFAMPVLFAVGIAAGVRLNRPKPSAPWLMLAAAGLVTVAGYCLWVAGASTVAFTVFLLVYPMEAVALLLIVRGASWRRDRAGMLDTAMICVGLGLACWLLVITPLMRLDDSLPGDVLSALFPFGDVLLLGVLIRFFTSRGQRNAAFWQMSASVLLQTVTHMSTLIPLIFAVTVPDLQPLTSFAAFLMAGAAIHPSMRILTGRPLRPVTEMSPRRVMLVNLACMAAPALLLAQGFLQDGKVDWIAAGIGCILLFALVSLRMVDLVGQVQDKARQLDAVAHIDALTTLPNRRAWDLELYRRIAAARRHGNAVVVAIIDLDHFKRYNDEHGHQGGDELLTDAAAAWRTQVRPEDLLARYGGEEFGAILDHARLADADRIIERLQAVTPLGQTFSAGAAQWDGSETPEELVARADAALYAAKRAGRDRLYVSSTR